MLSQAQKGTGFQTDATPGICLPVGCLGSPLGSWEPLAFHAGSWTELRSVPDSSLGSAVVKVVQFASSPQSGLSPAALLWLCFGLSWARSSGSGQLLQACSSSGFRASFSSCLVPRSDGAEHHNEALAELAQPLPTPLSGDICCSESFPTRWQAFSLHSYNACLHRILLLKNFPVLCHKHPCLSTSAPPMERQMGRSSSVTSRVRAFIRTWPG